MAFPKGAHVHAEPGVIYPDRAASGVVLGTEQPPADVQLTVVRLYGSGEIVRVPTESLSREL